MCDGRGLPGVFSTDSIHLSPCIIPPHRMKTVWLYVQICRKHHANKSKICDNRGPPTAFFTINSLHLSPPASLTDFPRGSASFHNTLTNNHARPDYINCRVKTHKRITIGGSCAAHVPHFLNLGATYCAPLQPPFTVPLAERNALELVLGNFCALPMSRTLPQARERHDRCLRARNTVDRETAVVDAQLSALTARVEVR